MSRADEYPPIPDGSSVVRETTIASPEPEPIDDPYPRLKPSHQRFVDRLVECGNQTQAYLAAGYSVSPKIAKSEASRLLSTNVNVAQAYAIRKADLAVRAAISQDMVIAELKRVGFVDLTELSKVLRASDKVRALQLLGQTLGMFADEKSRDQRQLILDLSIEQHVEVTQQTSGTEHLLIDIDNTDRTSTDLTKPRE